MIITEFYEETKAIKTAAIEAVEIFIRVVIYLRLLPKIVINKKNNKVIYKSSVITKVSLTAKGQCVTCSNDLLAIWVHQIFGKAK